ncbi:MAG: UbiA family prenyltransferase [Burkholderiales bacterium]
MSTGSKSVLCVDLDGTLVRTDTLQESLVALLRHRPWMAFVLPWWLVRGRAYFKARVAGAIELDPESLPYNAELVDFLREERRSGRVLALATASHVTTATRVAGHLGIFAAVHASEGPLNCKGAAKAEALASAYGERAFAYAGDSRGDLAVWKRAQSAVLVNVAPSVRAELDGTHVEREFRSTRSRAFALWRLLRPHQWAKNALVAVPLLTAHRYDDDASVLATVLAFVAMCMTASAIYVVNDLLDLPADRRHPTKRTRPFAAGTLPLALAAVVVPLLALGAILAAAPLPAVFSAGLAGYALAAIVYSLWVKHVAWLDALWLAGMYTLRIDLGGLAIDVPVSGWLFAFSFLAFGSLALLKRFTELLSLADRPGVDRARGYHFDDRRYVEVAGWLAALLAGVLLIFYFRSETVATLYRQPHFLWGVAPLLMFLVVEVWWSARAGRMHEDPVLYAVRKPLTYLVLGGVLALILLARLP